MTSLLWAGGDWPSLHTSQLMVASSVCSLGLRFLVPFPPTFGQLCLVLPSVDTQSHPWPCPSFRARTLSVSRLFCQTLSSVLTAHPTGQTYWILRSVPNQCGAMEEKGQRHTSSGCSSRMSRSRSAPPVALSESEPDRSRSSSSLSALLRLRGLPTLLFPLFPGVEPDGLAAAGGRESVPGTLRGLPRGRLTGGGCCSSLTRGGMGCPVISWPFIGAFCGCRYCCIVAAAAAAVATG